MESRGGEEIAALSRLRRKRTRIEQVLNFSSLGIDKADNSPLLKKAL
jgi:hypothetical protein